MKIYYCKWRREKGPKSHILLGHIVEEYLGEPATEAEFTVKRKGEYGKPYLVECPEVHFSITHVGDYWMCAVAGEEVGLDLQDVRERIAGTGSQEERVLAIARRFFHPTEVMYLAKCPTEEFFRVWAKKESYVKYTGEGLTAGFDSFSVTDGVPAVQQEIPFAEGYILVLTTGQEAQIRMEECPVPVEEPPAEEENTLLRRRRGRPVR